MNISSISTTIRCRRWRRWKATSTTLRRRCFRSPRRSPAGKSDEIDHLARHAGLAQGMAQVIARISARCLAASAVRAAAVAAAAMACGMEEVFAGKQTPKLRRRDRPARRRSARPSEDGVVAARERAAGGAADFPAVGAG